MSALRCCLYCGRDTASRSQVCSRCMANDHAPPSPESVTIADCYDRGLLPQGDEPGVYRDYEGELPSDDI